MNKSDLAKYISTKRQIYSYSLRFHLASHKFYWRRLKTKPESFYLHRYPTLQAPYCPSYRSSSIFALFFIVLS